MNTRRLKAAFSYYGSKAKIAAYYPAPRFDTIIEPFAGSAAYSIRYFEKDVWLYDIHDDIILVWEWLIKASSKDVLSLPDMKPGLDIRTLSISPGEKAFMGFWSSRGSAAARNIVSSYALGNTNGHEYWNNIRRWVAEFVPKIKHWHINKACYTSLPNSNLQTVWFIDPPYRDQGKHYKHSSICYDTLKMFCLSRNGQVIVCESGADWLPFLPLVHNTGSRKVSIESVWTNA